jgi:hypothetical protein
MSPERRASSQAASQQTFLKQQLEQHFFYLKFTWSTTTPAVNSALGK